MKYFFCKIAFAAALASTFTLMMPIESAQAQTPGVIHQASMQVGNELISLSHGVHRSKKSGEYKGNGVYSIWMDDGGNGPDFTMKFQIVSLGSGRYELRRLDCPDPPIILINHENGVLKGGPCILNFHL